MTADVPYVVLGILPSITPDVVGIANVDLAVYMEPVASAPPLTSATLLLSNVVTQEVTVLVADVGTGAAGEILPPGNTRPWYLDTDPSTNACANPSVYPLYTNSTGTAPPAISCTRDITVDLSWAGYRVGQDTAIVLLWTGLGPIGAIYWELAVTLLVRNTAIPSPHLAPASSLQPRL